MNVVPLEQMKERKIVKIDDRIGFLTANNKNLAIYNFFHNTT